MGGTRDLNQKMFAACTEAFCSQCHKSSFKVLKYLYVPCYPQEYPKLNVVSQAHKGSTAPRGIQ